MNTVGTRIKKARAKIGLSQTELAETAKVSQPTIANWENDSHIPRRASLENLANILKTSVFWLESGIGEDPDDENLSARYLSRPIHHIPVLNWPDISHIGENGLMLSKPKDYLASSIECKKPFALIANDPAMAALFPVGVLIIFEKQPNGLQDGKSYLFAHNNKIILRRWQSEPDRMEALPNLSAVDSILPSERPKPLAKAILSLRKH